ncbi:MAG: lamin tail domain-containing protein [Chitinophagaceae bacterium]
MKTLLCLLILTLFTRFCHSQNRYDVVIDEIMADPAPPAGLPNYEWIEIKNRSTYPINLQGWRLGDLTSVSGNLPNFILQPDSIVIICSGTAAVAMAAFGSCIGVTGLPSLDNDGEVLFIKAVNGSIIHCIEYSSGWYQNELKKEGGWTLEMMDTNQPCAGSANWRASIDDKGGTPGKSNSINNIYVDSEVPGLLNAYTTDSTTIILVYDEPVDSVGAAIQNNYLIDGGLQIISSITLPPLFNQVQLKLNVPLQFNTVYTLSVSNVTDCKGNRIPAMSKIETGRPLDIKQNELIINEILFNPIAGGFDYIEFYNRSNKIIDASKLFVANRNSGNTISSITSLSNLPFYIFPGDYIVVTEDAAILGKKYFVKNNRAVLECSSLPSFPDDKGIVVLLNQQGEIADEVSYRDDWHFKLLTNTEGISLERIDPTALSQSENNWHSAASTAGYGTPGYRNSQYKNPDKVSATIEVIPKTFSPDNDGFDDIISIQYKMDDPGYVANVVIFDAAGRPVKTLVRNGTLSTEGYWNWDGLNDTNQKLPAGIYTIYTQVFNLRGKKDQFKNVVVLAGKL